MNKDKRDSSVLSELDVVNWKQLLGNKWAYALTPQMLLPEGYTPSIPARVVGGSTRQYDLKLRRVTFDREFVILWMVNCIFKKLKPVAYKEIENLLWEAYSRYETGMLNGETINTRTTSMDTPRDADCI